MKKDRFTRVLLQALSLVFFTTMQSSWANNNENALADITATVISFNKTNPVAVCSLKSLMACTIIININNPAALGILKITNNSSYITAYDIDAILPPSLVNEVDKSRTGCDIVLPHGLCTITFASSESASTAVPPQEVPVIGTNVKPTFFYLGTTY